MRPDYPIPNYPESSVSAFCYNLFLLPSNVLFALLVTQKNTGAEPFKDVFLLSHDFSLPGGCR